MPAPSPDHARLLDQGQGEPPEIGRVENELARLADDHERTGAWLGEAMRSAWGSAEALLGIAPLADLLGERLRIIAGNWQNAALITIVPHLLRRARDILARVEFRPAAIREDLGGARVAPSHLYSAAELVDRAADLLTEGAVLVHDSERRWRTFSARVRALREASGS